LCFNNPDLADASSSMVSRAWYRIHRHCKEL
jgi:hypothetical protein